MTTATKNKISGNYVVELKYFVENHLSRILGIPNCKLKKDSGVIDGDIIVQVETSQISQETRNETSYTLLFLNGKNRVFRLDLNYGIKLTNENLRLARRIIQEFNTITKYKRFGSSVQNDFYPSESSKPIEFQVYRREMYERAIETGICHWVAGDNSGASGPDNYVEELFSLLKKWSVKTYEGKSVTLGFIINPEEESQFQVEKEKWLHFLEFIKDDAAAVLTDCIHSVFEIDRNCNLLRHISVSEGNHLESCDLDYRIPLRFTQIIRKHVKGKKVGIFLLSNGDLVLAKNGEMRFVKRNLQWLNLSYDAFQYAMRPFTEKYLVNDDKLIQSVFASVLDVSFSHAGGIISVVNTEIGRTPGFDWSILNDFDNLRDGEIEFKLQRAVTRNLLNEEERELQDIQAEFAEKRKILPESSNLDKEEREKIEATHKNYEDERKKLEDNQKRFLKRTVLKKLVNYNPFWDIDRKLRSELISLDGACILDCTGNVISFGAIIQNDCGSSGGGRGAAAKKLSKYGMAVKISTDGYIEVYYGADIVYEIK